MPLLLSAAKSTARAISSLAEVDWLNVRTVAIGKPKWHLRNNRDKQQ